MSMELIKKLRDEFGAGVGACQKALKEANGNYEEAITILRKQGESKAKGKSSRETSEGLVGMKQNENGVSIIELKCETDFVAKNEKFQILLNEILEISLENKVTNVEHLLELKTKNSTKISNYLMAFIGSIGENMSISRIHYIEIKNNIHNIYIHNSVKNYQNLGQIIVILTAKGEKNDASLNLLKNISMHIAATNPIALNIESVSKEVIEKEKEIFTDQAKSSGKPEDIAIKIAEGKLRKFFEENVLLEQILVMDGKENIKNIIQQSKTNIELIEFKRIQLGVK